MSSAAPWLPRLKARPRLSCSKTEGLLTLFMTFISILHYTAFHRDILYNVLRMHRRHVYCRSQWREAFYIHKLHKYLCSDQFPPQNLLSPISPVTLFKLIQFNTCYLLNCALIHTCQIIIMLKPIFLRCILDGTVWQYVCVIAWFWFCISSLIRACCIISWFRHYIWYFLNLIWERVFLRVNKRLLEKFWTFNTFTRALL